MYLSFFCHKIITCVAAGYVFNAPFLYKLFLTQLVEPLSSSEHPKVTLQNERVGGCVVSAGAERKFSGW